jgi:hypothetical protein
MRWPETRRLALFTLPLCLPLALVAYLTLAVPVSIPMHDMRDDAVRYWPAALAAVAVVLTAAGFVALQARRRAREPAYETVPAERGPWFPQALGLQATPALVIAGVAAISVLLASMATMHDMPLWSIVLAAALPWFPVIVAETIWKHQRCGVFALLWFVTLLQVGHMGEHTTQVSQLLATDGDIDRSHGVFGALDFETVHFYWDTTIWLITALMLHRFVRNPWLWVAFGAASLHQMEHVYLYFVYLADMEFYGDGGLAGILGKGGVIGSPLARPYLHFTYNLFVTVPMVLACWHEARRVELRSPVPASSQPRSATSPDGVTLGP